MFRKEYNFLYTRYWPMINDLMNDVEFFCFFLPRRGTPRNPQNPAAEFGKFCRGIPWALMINQNIRLTYKYRCNDWHQTADESRWRPENLCCLMYTAINNLAKFGPERTENRIWIEGFQPIAGGGQCETDGIKSRSKYSRIRDLDCFLLQHEQDFKLEPYP